MITRIEIDGFKSSTTSLGPAVPSRRSSVRTQRQVQPRRCPAFRRRMRGRRPRRGHRRDARKGGLTLFASERTDRRSIACGSHSRHSPRLGVPMSPRGGGWSLTCASISASWNWSAVSSCPSTRAAILGSTEWPARGMGRSGRPARRPRFSMKLPMTSCGGLRSSPRDEAAVRRRGASQTATTMCCAVLRTLAVRCSSGARWGGTRRIPGGIERGGYGLRAVSSSRRSHGARHPVSARCPISRSTVTRSAARSCFDFRGRQA